MATDRKTRKTTASVSAFLRKSAAGEREADCRTLVKLMERATGEKAAMWGDAIVGCGSHPIVYANGDTLDWPVAAFSPRKDALTIYGLKSAPKFAALTKKLGKHKVAGGCLHIRKLADIDVKVLAELIDTSVRADRARRKAK